MNPSVLLNNLKSFIKRRRENDAFCIIPWIHMFVAPDGDITACCMENPGAIRFGNWNEVPLEKAWNSPEIKKFRKDLMSGKRRPDVCSRCYLREEHGGSSHRIEYNWRFRKKKKAALAKTDSDGTMSSMDLPYWDFRFSNLCNLRCRTCGPSFSSSWEKDVELLGWKDEFKKRPQHRTDRFAEVEKQIPSVEEIYFAGGEPLLNKEHYRILELLIEQKRTNVLLSYNSNCTQLQLGSVSVLPLWKKFKRINLSPSVDDIGPQAEFLRKGTRWPLLVKNIKTIKQEVPWIKISPTVTVSVFNVMRIGSVIEDLLSEGIIDPKKVEFQINMVDYPEHYHAGILTPALKEVALKELRDAKNRLTEKYGNHFQAFAIVEGSIKQDMKEFRPVFLQTTAEIDRVRNENTFAVYPELMGLQDAT